VTDVSVRRFRRSRVYLLTLFVLRFLLKYERLAHVRMKKSILWMNHRSSGVRSSESQRISRKRRLRDLFSSTTESSGVVSLVCGCDSGSATMVVVSLSEGMTASNTQKPSDCFSRFEEQPNGWSVEHTKVYSSIGQDLNANSLSVVSRSAYAASRHNSFGNVTSYLLL
jgi:hypothetical protein